MIMNGNLSFTRLISHTKSATNTDTIVFVALFYVTTVMQVKGGD